MERKKLSLAEKERYNRHIILDEINEKGQEKIKNAKVLVVGAGGLGSPVLRYLTAAGVGTIGIVDNDIVSESNLQRQILYDTTDVGISKAQVAKQKLGLLNPHTTFEVFETRFEKDNGEEIASNFDIIVDCTDNYEARYTINAISKKLKRPMVYGSIFKFEGQLSVFNYKNGPSYDMLFPEAPPVNTKPDALGVMGVLPGVLGTLQATEVIKIILDLGECMSGKLLVVNLLKNDFTVFNIG